MSLAQNIAQVFGWLRRSSSTKEQASSAEFYSHKEREDYLLRLEIQRAQRDATWHVG